MADLIVHIPQHGYSESDYVTASWLEGPHYVRKVTTNTFVLSTDDSDNNVVQFTETITDGTVQLAIIGGSGTISGLGHLEGETVQVFADGEYKGEFTVSSGEITLDNQVSNALVGLGYESTVLPMKLNVQEAGLLPKKRQAINILSFYNTSYAEYGSDLNTLYEVPFETSGLSEEDVVVHPDTGYTRASDFYVYTNRPLPCTLLGVSIILDAATG